MAVEDLYASSVPEDVRDLFVLTEDALAGWLASAPAAQSRWVADANFRARAGQVCLLPGDDGRCVAALAGIGKEAAGLRHGAAAAALLPPGIYRLAGGADRLEAFVTGWGQGQYCFDRYRSVDTDPRVLIWPDQVARERVLSVVRADRLIRDLVNTPASDLGPAELETAALEFARASGCEWRVVSGEALLSEFPAIHAVGRASDRGPRLIDLRWGDAGAPRITLVGKGVCFDSGGLDIKPAAGMRLMKKDMGGAAHVLGLACMIVDAGLPVRLRVLIPAVENAISGNAYRPGDVIETRKGISVEIGNTDAEGRMVLCDALALADEEAPDVLIDMATLTGAARVALGPELPALYCDDDAAAEALMDEGRAVDDPVWRMPIWRPYDRDLSSTVADVNHIAGGPFAGSIYGALFLHRFVEAAGIYVHLDIYAWNAKDRPGRPEGAESQSARALFAWLAARYRPA
jgi:leucyl aminopeptidase